MAFQLVMRNVLKRLGKFLFLSNILDMDAQRIALIMIHQSEAAMSLDAPVEVQ